MKRILLVDDNRLDRKVIYEILKHHFSNTLVIDEASDGESAIKFISQRIYDVIVTDLVMPNIEGIQLIQYINAHCPSTGVIAISGNRPYYLFLAKKLGIHGVFTKPLDAGRFLRTVENLLQHPHLITDRLRNT